MKKKIAVFSFQYLPFCDGTISCLHNVLKALSDYYDITVFCRREDLRSREIENNGSYSINRNSVLNDYFISAKLQITKRVKDISNVRIRSIINCIIVALFAPASVVSRVVGNSNVARFSHNIKKVLKNGSYDYVLCTDASIATVRGVYEALSTVTKLEWVFLQFDLYCNNPSIDKTERKQRYEEQLLWYKRAKMIVLQPEMLKYVKGVGLERYLNKIHDLYLPSLAGILENVSPQKNNDLTIVYAGSFYDTIRNPQKVFEILFDVSEVLDNIKLKVYSRGCEEIVSKYQNKFGNKMTSLGFIRREELEKEYLSSDFILSIGNTFDEMVPSKTLEIVRYRKPILHFALKSNDVSAQYLRDYPKHLIIDVSSKTIPSDMVSKIIKFIKENNGAVCDFNRVNNVYGKYTASNYAKDIYDYLER